MSELINLATAADDSSAVPERTRLSLSPSTIYGATSFAMFLQGFSMWYKYPHAIATDPTIPERPSDIADWDYTTLDKTWAYGTLEMSAWTYAATVSCFSFGAGFVLWALNVTMDNEGGDLHRLFYRSMQHNAVILPIAMVVGAGRLYAAHNAGPSTSSYERAYWNTFMSEAWGNPHYYAYNSYDPTAKWVYLSDERDSQAQYWFAILLWFIIARGTFGSLKETWLEANENAAMEELLEWANDIESTEDKDEAAAEEPAADEQFFF